MLERGAFVLDTNILGSSLRPGGRLWQSAGEIIDDAAILVSFITVAELRFGASLASWGERRLVELEERLDAAEVVWPGPRLAAGYVDLRTWATRAGHPLSGRAHEADRWIAATALSLDQPLVTSDLVFASVPGLDVRVVTASR